VRRIEVPSTQVFKARNNYQLPLPVDSNADGKRRFENLFKTDATLFFEVSVTKIVEPLPDLSINDEAFTVPLGI
jgi:hypothetical protein